MKAFEVIGTTALFLLVGAAVPAFGQEEHHEQEAKPVKQEGQPKPESKAKPEKQEVQAKPEKQHEQSQHAKQQAGGNTAEQRQPERSAAERQKQSSQPALKLSVRGTGRIPEDRFRANFGSAHRFSIGSPTMADGYSRFQYSGFWFGFLQPWPEGWYYTDNFYVDYIDGGYFLCDPFYPGVKVSISVVL